MRKSTYESRMKDYIGMLIAFGIGMIAIGIVAQLQLDLNNAGTYAMQLPAIETMAVAELEELDEVYDTEEYEEEFADTDDEEYVEEGEEDTLAELAPDDYDGKIVIATADEVITMTVDEDGVKRFTNHMVG